MDWLRAAFAQSKLSDEDIYKKWAKHTGRSKRTFERRKQEGFPFGDLRLFAEICEVPLAYLLHGFPPATPQRTEWAEGNLRALLDRVVALEAELQELKTDDQKRIAELEDAIRRLTVEAEARAAEALPLPAEESGPTQEPPPQQPPAKPGEQPRSDDPEEGQDPGDQCPPHAA